jgi:hypothetical protein
LSGRRVVQSPKLDIQRSWIATALPQRSSWPDVTRMGVFRQRDPRVTPREELHLLVDQLSDAEAEATLARLVRERELLRQWAAQD